MVAKTFSSAESAIHLLTKHEFHSNPTHIVHHSRYNVWSETFDIHLGKIGLCDVALGKDDMKNHVRKGLRHRFFSPIFELRFQRCHGCYSFLGRCPRLSLNCAFGAEKGIKMTKQIFCDLDLELSEEKKEQLYERYREFGSIAA